jgi:hypothetical protein
MTFYLSFIVFILSIIGGLVLMLVGKNMDSARFRLLAALHFILLLAFIASVILRQDHSVVINNYFFTAFFCSGVLLSGIAWRAKISKAFRYYFSLFLLGIPMFVFSPSMMMNFLVTTHYSSTTGEAFHLQGKYYLELQSTVPSNDNIPHYKVIRKTGIFHKTIQRDVVFQGTIDSVKVLDLSERTMTLRGYTSKKTHVSEEIDSTDVEITLVQFKPGDLEYRL